jgi:DNA-binding protein WhiA
VYIKSKELISDFLSIIGVENCLRKFSSLVEKRDKANNDNRTKNCMAGNADKAAIAAVKQVVAIGKLKNSSGFSELSSELKVLAKARLDNPSMSLQELADKLGVSKSCLNHRMRKLMELAGELD